MGGCDLLLPWIVFACFRFLSAGRPSHLSNCTQVSMTIVAAFLQSVGVASLRIAKRYWQDTTSAVLFPALACPLLWSEHPGVDEKLSIRCGQYCLQNLVSR